MTDTRRKRAMPVMMSSTRPSAIASRSLPPPITSNGSTAMEGLRGVLAGSGAGLGCTESGFTPAGLDRAGIFPGNHVLGRTIRDRGALDRRNVDDDWRSIRGDRAGSYLSPAHQGASAQRTRPYPRAGGRLSR